MNEIMDAICTQCGETRTCKRPKNYRYDEGLGDLRCQHCARITTHAVLHPSTHERNYQRWEEERDAIMRGIDPSTYGYKYQDLAERRAEYRLQQPQNPYLSHIYRGADEARARGETRIRAHCGAWVDLPKRSSGRSVVDADYRPVAKTEEYEGPDGEFWVAMDCVDCARVANAAREAEKRDLVSRWAVWVLKHLANKQLKAAEVHMLAEAFLDFGSARKFVL